MLDLALHRDGVELLPDRLRAADDAHAIAAEDLGFDDRGRREHAQAVFAELLRLGAVVQLGDDARPDVFGLEPVLERSWGAPTVTKDGVTVAKEIELEDRLANMGAQMVKEGTNDCRGCSGAVCRDLLRTAVEVVCFQGGDGEGPVGVAMINAVDDVMPGRLTVAVASLDTACRELDAAVLAMSDVPGDDVMASPGLMSLLLRVVAARRQVERLELEAGEIRDRSRASTVS